MYDQSARTGSSHGQRSSRVNGRPGGRTGKPKNRGKERVLMVQLLVCLALFLTVFIGKGVLPSRLLQLRTDVLQMISQDFDFQEALAELGTSLAGSDSVLSDFGEFCVEVFGAEEQEQAAQPVEFQPPDPAAVLTSELTFLSGQPDALARTEHYSSLNELGITLRQTEQPAPEETAQEAEEETNSTYEGAIMPAGKVFRLSDYDGPALPNNYTMDVLSFGGLETMTPVLGHMNSPYGYRTNPVNGEAGDFHGGVDIGGQTGDPIRAFASGTVEYIGQDNSYGMYLQIDHGNGVKSFYAHCSQILVKKGQKVTIGDTVALVGSTGTATGPHLHLELKYEKMHVNPAYYVEFLNDQ